MGFNTVSKNSPQWNEAFNQLTTTKLRIRDGAGESTKQINAVQLDKDVVWSGFKTGNASKIAQEKLYAQSIAVATTLESFAIARKERLFETQSLELADQVTNYFSKINDIDRVIDQQQAYLDHVSKKHSIFGKKERHYRIIESKTAQSIDTLVATKNKLLSEQAKVKQVWDQFVNAPVEITPEIEEVAAARVSKPDYNLHLAQQIVRPLSKQLEREAAAFIDKLNTNTIG